MFLEEDHYVAEDFLHVMGLLRREREKQARKADIICLGTYLKHAKSGADSNYVRVFPFKTSFIYIYYHYVVSLQIASECPRAKISTRNETDLNIFELE